jgi:uncharacterized protein
VSFGGPHLGGVGWVDLGLADVDAGAAFYRGLFGWVIGEPDGTGYRLASLGGRWVAALGPAEEAGNPYWTVYVTVPDVRATLRPVVAAGGTVAVAAATVGDVGDFAVIRDPAGDPLSLWQPGTGGGSYAAGVDGAFARLQFRGPDPDSAGEFLGAVLGWRFEPDGAIRHAGRAVATWLRADDPGARSPWLVHFGVTAVRASTRRALDLGATPVGGQPGVMLDPAGARFALTALA